MVGQSTAGKLVKYMKDVLNIAGVEHQLFMAPLTDHKVDRLIAYLEASNLEKNDTIIFDLTCNFAPSPHMNSVKNRSLSTGKAKVKKFHLADTKGLKLVVPSTASVDNLLKRIARATGSVTNKDVLAINLSPLPRYQGSCCVVTTHGLQGNENSRTLNTLLVLCTGLAMLMLWSPRWTVWASELFLDLLLAETMFIPLGSTLALTILSIRKLHQCGNLPGLLPLLLVILWT